MSEFAVVISCKMNESDNHLTSFVLDTVNDTNINSSVTMTTFPVVSGDLVADHIYNNADSLSLSGTFSLNGSKGIVVDQEGAKLEAVQTLFDKIKREGILCEIVKVHNTTTKEMRFKHHSNMVLTSISWTEKTNSLDFTFNFKEALLSAINEDDLDPKDTDGRLPSVTDPVISTFTDTLIDWNSITSSINEMLKAENLITDGFLNYLSGLGASALVALGVGTVVAALVVGTFAVSRVAGLVIGVIAAAGVFIYGLYKVLKKIVNKNKYKIEQFKLYKSEEENKKEVKRYCNFTDEIHKNLLQLNNAIKVYSVSSDKEQECQLSLDNNYYQFKFVKNNTTGEYDLIISNAVTEEIIKDVGSIASSPTDFSKLSSENYLFRTDEIGSYVYLLRTGEDLKVLTNYYIVYSSMNLNNYNEAISKIIKNALMY